MKMLLVLVLTSLSQYSYADTQGFFSDEKAIVILQGQAGDSDATGLYNALNVTPTEDSSFFKKALSYTTVSKVKVLDIVCKISKTISNFGSCTLILYKSQWTSIGESSVLFAFERDTDSKLVGSLFTEPDENGRIYGSSDGKLSIRLDSDDTKNKLFSIAYR